MGVVNTLYIYDIVTNSWSQGAPMASNVFGAAGTIVEKQFWVMGGANSRSTRIYDPETNIWTAGPDLNDIRSDTGAVTLERFSGPMVFTAVGQGDPFTNVLTSSEANLLLGCPNTMSISGRVMYENAASPAVPVPGVNLNAPGSIVVNGSTNTSGNYSMAGFGEGAYTVTPSRPTQLFTTSNGIFSNDASLISRHVVGLQTLSATQLKAAMVGGGPGLSSFDAGLLAQYIVGIPNVNNQTGQWKFTPVNRTYPSITSSQVNQDYAATLMGDVSGDWNPAGPRPFEVTTRPLPWDAVLASVPNVKGGTGQTLTVPLRLDNTGGEPISSYQFTLEYDPAVIEPAKIAASLAGTMADGMSLAFNSPEPGVLNVVVYSAFPITGDGIYIELNFEVIGKPGSATPLSIAEIRLNDGKNSLATIDGHVEIGNPNNASDR
jgi:hypothetical protein